VKCYLGLFVFSFSYTRSKRPKPSQKDSKQHQVTFKTFTFLSLFNSYIWLGLHVEKCVIGAPISDVLVHITQFFP